MEGNGGFILGGGKLAAKLAANLDEIDTKDCRNLPPFGCRYFLKKASRAYRVVRGWGGQPGM
jgi:hypothetical protein